MLINEGKLIGGMITNILTLEDHPVFIFTDTNGVLHYKEAEDILTLDPIWPNGGVVEVRENEDDDDPDWEMGVIVDEEGGEYTVEFTSGKEASGIPSSCIRPFFP